MNNKEFEWWILSYISAFIAIKAITIYESNYQSKYLYLFTGALMLFYVAMAKVKCFNIFKPIRQLPKTIKRICKFMIADYRNWKQTGRRL